MKRVLFLSVIIFSLLSCNNNEETQRIHDLEAKIDHLQSKIKSLKDDNKGKLAHIVYLKLREDIRDEEYKVLIKAIEDLDKISVVEELHLGKIAKTGDTRFISDHELMFQITVDKKSDLDIYQKDSIHLKLKRLAKEYLSKPPAVYDYWIY